ncbi:MAG: hypothetical protein M5U09_07580 [Gammaproteobacteria bacterium]|nr:hypothetical protein [Gammaproteobacteria bacterium]
MRQRQAGAGDRRSSARAGPGSCRGARARTRSACRRHPRRGGRRAPVGISGYSQIYNDPYQWPLIFKHNRDQIEDADLIYPGQELKIKRDLTEAQVQQAIEHAKTRGAWSLGPTEQSDLDYLSKAL